MSDSEVVDKTQCPECAKNGGDNSGDNLAIYDDGHAHCFACGYHKSTGFKTGGKPKEKPMFDKVQLITEAETRALSKRSITEETCAKFRYQIGKDAKGKTVQVANYIRNGNVVAQKVRDSKKNFMFLGSPKEAGLFGQHLWRDGGKRLIITEGEIDALSVSQMQGNKWPVVSVPNGAQGAAKSIASELEFVEGYESVVFAFDMDEPGQAAAKECAALLSPGKAYIASLPLKDANDCLRKGKSKELISSLWDAKPFRPDGLIWIDDIIEEAEKPVEWGKPWCFPTLTELTYGRRGGELYAFGAGTGIGKTDVMTQQIEYDVNELDEKCGVIYLEQGNVETARRIAGKAAGRRFHVPEAGWTVEEQRAALNKMRGKVMLYDSFGATDWDVIRAKVRYMVLSCGIKHIYLDHLTAMADTSREKESIEEIMKQMAGTNKELDAIMHFVSHLSTPDGKPHEEGGRVMIRHFKGSRSIGFWSYFMFGLERDQQAEDEEMRKLTIFRILKDRYTGQSTGKTFGLSYDEDTGRLFECPLPEKERDEPTFGPVGGSADDEPF